MFRNIVVLPHYRVLFYENINNFKCHLQPQCVLDAQRTVLRPKARTFVAVQRPKHIDGKIEHYKDREE